MTEDFSNFEIEDFAFNETFQQWVSEPDSPFQSFWESYLAEHPHQTDKILAARALVLELKADPPSSQHTDLVHTIWENVQKRIQPKQPFLHNKFSTWQRAAAIVVILAGLGTLVWLKQSKIKNENIPLALSESGDDQLMEEVNRSNNTIKIYLADGSVVSLARDSRLIYPKKFTRRDRVVHLSGEAFFEVTKNPDKPFLIYANETVTKVLGTSFRIKAYQGASKVVVAVRTGKVSVFAKKDFEENPQNLTPAGIVLTANQQAEFSRKQEQFSKTLVEEPKILESPRLHLFDFDNIPLADVFTTLEKAYGVEIVYDPDLVANRSLKVSFEDETLYEKLKVICNTMGMSYQIVDAKIIIEKKN